MEHWLNNTDPANAESLEKNLYQCPFIHHKSYTSWPGIEPGCPWLKACNHEMAPKQFHYTAVRFGLLGFIIHPVNPYKVNQPTGCRICLYNTTLNNM